MKLWGQFRHRKADFIPYEINKKGLNLRPFFIAVGRVDMYVFRPSGQSW